VTKGSGTEKLWGEKSGLGHLLGLGGEGGKVCQPKLTKKKLSMRDKRHFDSRKREVHTRIEGKDKGRKKRRGDQKCKGGLKKNERREK